MLKAADQKCYPCIDPNCKVCSVDGTVCDECLPDNFKINSSTDCAFCPTAGYIDGTHPNQTCESCTIPGCLDCIDLFTCQTCDTANGYSISNDSSCHNCPVGQFLDFLNNTCEPCQGDCTSCGNNANDCTACTGNLVVSGTAGSRTCVDPPESQPGCDPSCASCETTTPTQCLTCPFGKCMSNTQTCIECPPSNFTAPEDNYENILERATLRYSVHKFNINDPTLYKLTFSEQNVAFISPLTIENIGEQVTVSYTPPETLNLTFLGRTKWICFFCRLHLFQHLG